MGKTPVTATGASGLPPHAGEISASQLRGEFLDLMPPTPGLGAVAVAVGAQEAHPVTHGSSRELPVDLREHEAPGCLVVAGAEQCTLEVDRDEVEDDQTGQILVDNVFQTSVPGVYAIGDLVPGPMLAHKASAEGIAAVESMADQPGEVNYDAMPAVVYTWPEVASVGMTEEEVKAKAIPYCTGTYPFSGAGRARCMGETDGFVKILSHGKTDRILGVHIIGPRAADMIAEAVLAIEFGASSEDIARTVHGHPTFAEALQEAAMGVRKCSIYAS